MPELRLEKLFRTTEEMDEKEEAHINGSVPKYVQGTFLRVGPGLWDFQNFTLNHWLDGYAIISKFEIDGESVKFQKKFLQSDAYKRACLAQRPVVCEFGTKAYSDPCKNMFSRFISSLNPIELTDNDQLSVFKMGNNIVVSSETSFFRSIDLCSLHTGEKYDTNTHFAMNIMSAHPIIDPVSQITYNVGLTVLTGLKYHIVAIPPGAPNQSAKEIFKKSKTISTISSSHSTMCSYTHSFGMTKNYIIFIEQPYVMLVKAAICSVFKNQSLKEWLAWMPHLKNKFFVINKSTGSVMKIDFTAQDPFFFLHFINCYEENNQIVVDLVAYPDPSAIDNMFLDKLRAGIFDEGKQPCGQRFVLPLVTDFKDTPENINLVEVKSNASAVRKGNQIILIPEILTEPGFEFPSVNRKFFGRKYNVFWGTGSAAPGFFENAICKIDSQTKEVTLWRGGGKNCFPGEPMFVPKPNGVAEDDGVLISAITDARPGANDFIIFLDAKTLKELGRAQFKAHIPQALHGLFLNK